MAAIAPMHNCSLCDVRSARRHRTVFLRHAPFGMTFVNYATWHPCRVETSHGTHRARETCIAPEGCSRIAHCSLGEPRHTAELHPIAE